MSGIVLWEIAKLTKLGRIELDLQSPQVKKVRSSIHVWPITLEIARTADISTCLSSRGIESFERHH